MSTVGIELEWADVDRHAVIPPHLGEWSITDYSIVNSDGHANDPSGATWRWGGEINTRPTDSADEQAEITRQLVELLSPTVNYKCNLHVHVGVPGLIDDLPLLKRVALYLRNAEGFVYSTIDPLVRPTDEDFPGMDALIGAIKRWRRNLTSHHYSVNQARWTEMMEATTPQEFKDAHAPPTKTGGRAWHVVPRAGMNLRSLWKHGTIEFRHFFGTVSPDEVMDAVRWCKLIVDEVTICERPRPPHELWTSAEPWRFPKPMPYVHELQLGFERTKWSK